jgi:hypothetical protein
LGQVRIGMPDKEAAAIMRPVSIDLGTVYLGGTGAKVLYFQVSSSQQVWLTISGAPCVVARIGKLEPKSKWIQHGGDSITVE